MAAKTPETSKKIISKPALTIIKAYSRFKVITTFYPELINFFKKFEGRYYEYATKYWSFPNENWGEFKPFLELKKYDYKVIKAENFVTISKTQKALHLKFGAYQTDFKLFEEVEGAVYSRVISKYVIPLEAFSQVMAILKERKFTFVIDEVDANDTDSIFTGPECSESSDLEEQEEPKKKKLKKIEEEEEEEEEIRDFQVVGPIQYAYSPACASLTKKNDNEKLKEAKQTRKVERSDQDHDKENDF